MNSEYRDHSLREEWLAPPPPHVRLNSPNAERTRRAVHILQQTASTAVPSRLRTELMSEAYASSLIENIQQNPSQPGNYANAFYQALQQALASDDPADVNDWHLTLMRQHPDPRIRPGHYRNLGVTIGGHSAPHYPDVPPLMQRLINWMRSEPDPLLKAIWGHRQFETIHPFADGNGRTGRLLICQALQAPITISRHIWWQRPQYYSLLHDSSWNQWSEWLLERIRMAAYRTTQNLCGGPLTDDSFTSTPQLSAL